MVAADNASASDHALAWAARPAGASAHWQAIRLSVVRGFAAYLHSLDPSAEVVPAGQFRPGVCRATPYLYSPAEIRSLIAAAATLRPRLRAAAHPAKPQVTAPVSSSEAVHGYPIRTSWGSNAGLV